MHCEQTMIRHLFPFLLALFAAATASAVTVNSLSLTNYTGYVIAADAAIAGAGTDRDVIAVNANVTFGTSALYRLEWALLDPSGATVASTTTAAALRSGTITVSETITPTTLNRLEPGTLYRVKLDVVKPTSGAVEATSTESPGHTFIHFTGTASGSDELNVVSEVTAVTINRAY
ncbi:MAG: hypothetical protein RIS79_1331, partial [Verrucomicrobiota bacterium]